MRRVRVKTLTSLVFAIAPLCGAASAQSLAEQALARGALRRSDQGSLPWRQQEGLSEAIWGLATNDSAPLDLRAAAFTSLAELSDDTELAARIRGLSFAADDPLAAWARRAFEKISARGEALAWLRHANENPIPPRRLVDPLAELLDDADDRSLRSDQRSTIYSSLRRLGWSDAAVLDRLSKRPWVDGDLRRSSLELLSRASPELFASQARRIALSSDPALGELLVRQREELPREAFAELVALLETQPEERVKILLAKVFAAPMGSVANAHLSRLASDLTESARVRLQALVTLIQHRSLIGEVSIERLIALETAFPDDERVIFIEAFASVDRSALRRWIERACADIYEDRRRLALQLAETLRISDLGRPMRALASDPGRSITERVAAIRILASTPGSAARDALLRLALQANTPMLRRAALEALAMPARSSASEEHAFLKALDDADESVVNAALRGLARASQASAAIRILELLKSPSETIQSSALRALKTVPIPDHLGDLLRAEPKTTALQEEWLQIFAAQPYRPVLARLCELLDARQASIRRRAWQILSSWLPSQGPNEQRPPAFDPDAPPLLRTKAARAWLDWYRSDSAKLKLRFED